MNTEQFGVRGSRFWVRVQFRFGVRLILVLLSTGVIAAPADTPLIDAARNGDVAAARRLLQQGASAQAAAADGMTPLHWAIRGDNLEIARALLAAGASAKSADRYGITPLALAAVNGHATAIEMLLKAGADPNAASGEGETVLMAAARTGKPEPIRLLLARGANPNASERGYGETALMWAAGHNHPEAVHALAKGGADLDARSTVINLPPAKVDLATMVTTALPRGGMTALMYAARQGAVDGAIALADAGADLNVTDPEGVTAIVLAIINAHFDVATALAEKGADPNVADSAGMAALYAAVDMVYPPNLLNRPKMRPTGPPPADLVKLLLKRGANPNQTLRAPLLMRQHSTGDTSLGDGATPLLRAAKVPDPALMRTLLEGGANPSLGLKNGTTPLSLASSGGRGARTLAPDTPVFQAVQALLEHGADANATNAAGETLLHQSLGRGEPFIRMLVRHGARLDIKDKSGRTPLDVAMGVPAAAAAAAPPATARGGRAGGGAGGLGGPGGRGAGPAPGPAQVDQRIVALLRELADTPAQ